MDRALGIEQVQMRIPEGYRDEHVEMDYRVAAFRVDARPVRLTRKEHELMSMLVRNAGEIVPRDVLLQRVWGYNKDVRTRTLDVHIRRLRKKLGAYGDRYIETVFGVGYRFQPYREPRAFSLLDSAMAVA